MKQHDLKLGSGHRWLLYLVVLTLLATGLAWSWLHRLEEAGTSTSSWRKLKPALMTAHGLAAMGFVLLVGALLPVHVRRAWNAGHNRPPAVLFLGAVGLLILTGHALYYLGGETARALCSNIHFWLGAAFPPLLILHIWSGRRATRNNSPEI